MQCMKTSLKLLRHVKARRELCAISTPAATSSKLASLLCAPIATKSSKYEQYPTWLAGIALLSVAAPTVLCEESPRPLSVQEVIILYEQVDANMRILSTQLMETLAYEIAKEEEENDGKRKLSVDERAIQMSETFEQLLAQVQDSVFRNHYVTKEQVADAMKRMQIGELPVTASEAETIHEYIRKLGRMRWECTGSREPIRQRQRNTAPKPLTTPIPRDVLAKMMETLITSLTKEMEIILSNVKARKADLKENSVRQEIATMYMDASKLVTDAVAAQFNVSVEEFQEALAYFHDDPTFQRTVQQLTDAQHERFVQLGL